MKFFTEHPADVGESYLEHLLAAAGFGLQMIVGGFACMIHGLLPGFFVKTGSNVVRDLYARIVIGRRSKPLPPGTFPDFVI